MEFHLLPHHAGGALLNRTANGWRLVMPAGSQYIYRLAQLDDFTGLARKHLLHFPPCTIDLRARLSNPGIPGTWGFGLWNDPFGLNLGFGGQTSQLPALPQTAWFMHASPPNWLSLQNNIPANGFFAGIFRSPKIPSLLLSPALLALPLCAIRPISRLLRKMAAHIVHQEANGIYSDVTEWHHYSISWQKDNCSFQIDGNEILFTTVTPHPPLGLVIWIDNQYAAWTPEGRISYGRLRNPDAWLEIDDLIISE